MTRIFEELEAETAKAGHDLTDWFRKPHPAHGYHQHQNPEGDDMTLAELKTGIDDLAAKARDIDAGALDKYATLKDNPVAAVLLDYPHVTAEQWTAVASLAKSYGDLVPVPAVPEPEAPAEPSLIAQ